MGKLADALLLLACVMIIVAYELAGTVIVIVIVDHFLDGVQAQARSG